MARGVGIAIISPLNPYSGQAVVVRLQESNSFCESSNSHVDGQPLTPNSCDGLQSGFWKIDLGDRLASYL